MATKRNPSGMVKRKDQEVARLVKLAQERVAEKLHGEPDPVPVWAYRTIVRTVLAEIGRDR